MNLPGFTAEASIYNVLEHYQHKSTYVYLAGNDISAQFLGKLFRRVRRVTRPAAPLIKRIARVAAPTVSHSVRRRS